MILVTGATGNVGRPLIDLLVSSGADVRAVVLTAPADAGLPAQVEVVQGDLKHPDAIASALRGVSAVFVNPRAVGNGIGELLALARQHGVKRVVTMSAMNVDDDLDDQPSRLNGDRNKEVEDAVTSSGLEWVALRSGFYAANTIGMWAAQVKAGDTVRGPYATWAAAPMHERDLAGVGAHALLTDDLIGQRPALTGPQWLSQAEMVTTIGGAIGRTLRYQEIPPEVAQQGMVGHGFSEAFAASFMNLLTRTVGQTPFTSNEVEKILGRPGLTYAEWAAEHAAEFRT